MRDLLGAQPRPSSGRLFIDYTDQVAQTRAVAATKAVRTIWIDHPPQDAIIARICKMLDDAEDVRGQQLPGLRLSEDTQAGKSGTLERCRAVLANRRRAAGKPPSPYELLIVGLDKKITLKGVYQDILIQMHDDNWQTGVEKVLRQRISEFGPKLGVRGICIDEVQHLRRDQGVVTDVTDAIKRLLDLGIAPLICVGDLDSVPFFQRNSALAARLGIPLDLTPLDATKRSMATYFKSFCRQYDEALVACGAVVMPAGLCSNAMLTRLHVVSKGHIGRVARILQHATEQAAWRGAVTIEAYDLSCVVRTFAMPIWIDHDPFAEGWR